MPAIPDFTSASWQRSRSKVQLMISILDGKDRQMPANRGVVSEGRAADLVAYIRTFAPVAQPKPTRVAPTETARARVAPTETAPAETAPAETDSGDFETEFNKLAKQFDDLRRQGRELALASAKVSSEQESTPPKKDNPDALPDRTAAESAPPSNPSPAVDKPQPTTVPISDRPFTPDDVSRGRELFLGQRRLANGGPSCVACHAAQDSAREGGRLGPDLTKVYERLGGRQALAAHLRASATPTMLSLYREHPLEEEEVLALAAYLEDAAREGAEDASGLPVKFLLMGLGGAVLGLVLLSTLWGSLSRRRGTACPATEPAAPLPPLHQDVAPVSQEECVGLGL
jgi:mono/diheme cytochrome c family protein